MDKNIAQEVNFVKNLANKLRTGGYKPGEYQNVILPFLLLRRFECIYSETKKDVLELLKKNPNASNEQLLHKSNCYFYNKSELDLEACVRSKDVKKDLKKYIESFSENIRTIYMGETDDDEKYFNIIGHIDRLGKNDILVPIIKAFSKYDLSTKRINQVQMGHIFEALLKEYSENEKAGQHFTPREIIKLKVKLLLDKYNKNETPIVYAGDFACGTGGILSCIHDELSTEYGLSDDRIKLFGQEIVPSTYAICLGDMIIKGQDPSNIRMISTLQKDITVPPYAKLQKDNKRDMDFVCENPPFGEPWGKEDNKSDYGANPNYPDDGVVRVEDKKEIKELNKRFIHGVPTRSDMQMLFMEDAIYKLSDKGRATIITNGSPLFNGGAKDETKEIGNESSIRKWLLDEDYLEAIIQLPTDLFYNTNIQIYIWILDKNKSKDRKNLVQLIDLSAKKNKEDKDGYFFKTMKGQGKKTKYISEEQITKILDVYHEFDKFKNKEIQDDDICKIFSKYHFYYKEVPLQQPYRRNFIIEKERIQKIIDSYDYDKDLLSQYLEQDEDILTDKEKKERDNLIKAKETKEISDQCIKILNKNISSKKWVNKFVFKKFLEDILNNIENSKKLINNFLVLLSEKDITCPIIDNKGNEKGSKSFDKNKIELDSELKDTEHIPYEMDIEEYFKKEVLPFLPDTIYDKKVYKIGVEFNFNKEFYKEVKLRSSKEILEDIKKVDDELKKLEDELYG